MAQKTAVQFLFEIWNSREPFDKFIFDEQFEQAKQMEKEQILDAYEQGAIDGRFEMFSDNTVHNAEAYYNKTFTE